MQAAEVFLASGMRPAMLVLLALPFVLLSCAPSDPDLDPRATTPESTSRQTPWNQPIPGQGGGAFGALPQEPRR